MSELRAIGGWTLRCPAGWTSVPTKPDDSDWPELVAAKLCDGGKARTGLARRLRKAHPALVDEAHLMVGVWVPDRGDGVVSGVVLLDWLLPDEDHQLTRDYYRGMVEPDRRQGVTVFSRRLDDVDVLAGPALRVQEMVSVADSRRAPWRKEVQENIVYTVFPPGCAEALTVTFIAYGVDAGEELAEHASRSLDTLEVQLGEVAP